MATGEVSATLATRVLRGNAAQPIAQPPGQPLAHRLADEMAQRWLQGDQVQAEHYFNLHPELRHDTEAALRLIYEEYCLLQQNSDLHAGSKMVARFPQWRHELLALVDCHRLFETPEFPAVGDTLADFHLLAELGRGGQGCVYLARQMGLGDRPIVLKVTPCTGQEHLSLARLQHTNIVPLYDCQEDLELNRRILCMPFFGGASLARVIDQLAGIEVSRRQGQHLISALDRAQASLPLQVPARGSIRRWLVGASFEQAICWLAACIADALQYAHERGLVHLDLSPSNILLTAEGQPMLLDFHLAREPLRKGTLKPDWLGGTPGYMAPELEYALAHLHVEPTIQHDVDERADIYALGNVLTWTLTGSTARHGESAQAHLCRQHGILPGLADILHKCLHADPAQRYASAAELAEDLRLQLAQRPLCHAGNRPRRFWTKWYARLSPGTWQTFAGSLLIALGLLAFAAPGPGSKDTESHVPAKSDSAGSLDCVDDAHRLHALVEQMRFQAVIEPLPPATLGQLSKSCQSLWPLRHRFAKNVDTLTEKLAVQVQRDLLDLAIIQVDLTLRGHADQSDLERGLAILDEAEQCVGSSAALQAERFRIASRLDLPTSDTPPVSDPGSCWEHLRHGLALMKEASLDEAQNHFDRAVALEPDDFWAHYYRGVCSCRRQSFRDAREAFTACIALSPQAAPCYLNRGVAFLEQGKLQEAGADFEQALRLSGDKGPARYHLALVALRRDDLAAARRHLEACMQADPHHAPAQALLHSLPENQSKQ